jgi:hypothetical protein
MKLDLKVCLINEIYQTKCSGEIDFLGIVKISQDSIF